MPPLTDYKINDPEALAKIFGHPTTRLNASLSIQLCYDWIKRNPERVLADVVASIQSADGGLTLHDDIVAGIVGLTWPGRCQIMQLGNKRLFLDGAHTLESIDMCAKWFIENTKES